MQILFIFFRMYRIVSLNIHNNGSIQINNLEVYLTSLQKKKKRRRKLCTRLLHGNFYKS